MKAFTVKIIQPDGSLRRYHNVLADDEAQAKATVLKWPTHVSERVPGDFLECHAGFDQQWESPFVTDKNASEFQCARWTIEASTLQLPPGVFPEMLRTSLGNGQPFMIRRRTPELVEYKQSLGCLTLTVFND